MTKGPNERRSAVDVPAEHEDESFLGRWLRRKREARGDRPPADGRTPRDATDAPMAGASRPDAPPSEKTDADLPPLDALDETSSYADFLSPQVSETLRRQALRKLFMSAKFNVIDGLDDYAEDYRSFQALGDIITSDMRYAMRREAEKARARAESSQPGESEAEQAAEEQAGDASGSAAAEAGADRRSTASEQSGGEHSDDTGSA